MFISIITVCTGNRESVLNTIFSSVTASARWPRYYGEVILSLCLKGGGEESQGIQPTQGPNRYHQNHSTAASVGCYIAVNPSVARDQVALALDVVICSAEAFLGLDEGCHC